MWLSRRVKNGDPHNPHHFIQKEQLADWFEKDIGVFTDRSTFFQVSEGSCQSCALLPPLSEREVKCWVTLV